MSSIQFKPTLNMVSMYNRKNKKNSNFTDKISVSESNSSFDKTISYINRKGDKQYKRI